MAFEKAFDFVVAAEGVEIEVLGIHAFKNEASFQPTPTLIESFAKVTDAESLVVMGRAKIITDAPDDFPDRFPRFWR